MDGGPKYEFGTPNSSQLFGTMLLLIFQAAEYLRYKNATVITDSAYGFLEAMLFVSIWGLKWVTSFRLAQRMGVQGISEFKNAVENKKGLAGTKSTELKTGEAKFSKKVAIWEKANKNDVKGTSYFWKGTFKIVRGVFQTVWLTAIMDSKFCYRLDNFLGPSWTDSAFTLFCRC